MRRGDPNWRDAHWGEPCHPEPGRAKVGEDDYRVDGRTVDAFETLGAVMSEHGYDPGRSWPDGRTGTYNCRRMNNDPRRPWSSHAWAIAIDVNWDRNPYGSTTAELMSDEWSEMVETIEGLRTVAGGPVFRWGGRWDTPDAMHFEIVATPKELETGIEGYEPKPKTKPEKTVVEKMRTVNLSNVTKTRSTWVEDPQVGVVQAGLLADGYGPEGLVGSDGLPDKIGGPVTKRLLGEFQSKHATGRPSAPSTPDHVAGEATYTAMFVK